MCLQSCLFFLFDEIPAVFFLIFEMIFCFMRRLSQKFLTLQIETKKVFFELL